MVETLRKPSTGLKQVVGPRFQQALSRRDTQKTQHGIETTDEEIEQLRRSGRDTQKTQHGIETGSVFGGCVSISVETLRKPSTGLKLSGFARSKKTATTVETLRKPSTGLKRNASVPVGDLLRSRHSENPARD